MPTTTTSRSRAATSCASNTDARVLPEILSRYPVEDLAVEDPPLEEVIAEVFSQVNVREEEREAIGTN